MGEEKGHKYILAILIYMKLSQDVLNIVNICTSIKKELSVVGKIGMDEYTMKYTYQIGENVWLDWEFKPGTPA